MQCFLGQIYPRQQLHPVRFRRRQRSTVALPRLRPQRYQERPPACKARVRPGVSQTILAHARDPPNQAPAPRAQADHEGSRDQAGGAHVPQETPRERSQAHEAGCTTQETQRAREDDLEQRAVVRLSLGSTFSGAAYPYPSSQPLERFIGHLVRFCGLDLRVCNLSLLRYAAPALQGGHRMIQEPAKTGLWHSHARRRCRSSSQLRV